MLGEDRSLSCIIQRSRCLRMANVFCQEHLQVVSRLSGDGGVDQGEGRKEFAGGHELVAKWLPAPILRGELSIGIAEEVKDGSLPVALQDSVMKMPMGFEVASLPILFATASGRCSGASVSSTGVAGNTGPGSSMA